MMDYSDVNSKHYRIIKSIYAMNGGSAAIFLKDGNVVMAGSPKEADEKLKEIERHGK